MYEKTCVEHSSPTRYSNYFCSKMFSNRQKQLEYDLSGYSDRNELKLSVRRVGNDQYPNIDPGYFSKNGKLFAQNSTWYSLIGAVPHNYIRDGLPQWQCHGDRSWILSPECWAGKHCCATQGWSSETTCTQTTWHWRAASGKVPHDARHSTQSYASHGNIETLQ